MKTKNCAQCLEDYEPKSNNSKYCSPACKYKDWRIKNREKVNKQRRKRYARSPRLREQIKEQHKRYHLLNGYLKRQEQYSQRYKEYHEEYNKRWRKKNKDRLDLMRRLRNNDGTDIERKGFEKKIKQDIRLLKKQIKIFKEMT